MKKFFILLIFASITSFAQQEKNLELIDIATIGGPLPQVGTSGYGSSISDTITLVVPANQYWVIVEATTTFIADQVGFSMSSVSGQQQGMWVRKWEFHIL